jgi:methionyl-tRNA formyltransferase
LRIVFLGSGAFAIPSFEALLGAGHEVKALVTQPDKASGRGRELKPPPLKPIAEARGVPVLQPRRVREPESEAALRALAPEVQVVVAYGQILPKAVIGIPPLGSVNLHGSILPRLRGAAPIQWAIEQGLEETGVTTMLIDEGLDTGPVLLTRRTRIGPTETAGDLEPRLARLGAELLLETLEGLQAGTLVAEPQDPARASLAPLIHKEDGRIDWTRGAEALARRVRAFHPWPGTHARIAGRGLKVLRARVGGSLAAAGVPGTLLRLGPEGMLVACGEGTTLALLEVQPESRRPMDAFAFATGARLAAGVRFES